MKLFMDVQGGGLDLADCTLSICDISLLFVPCVRLQSMSAQLLHSLPRSARGMNAEMLKMLTRAFY